MVSSWMCLSLKKNLLLICNIDTYYLTSVVNINILNVELIFKEVMKFNIFSVPPSPPVLAGTLIPVRLDEPTNVSCIVLNGKPISKITWKKDEVEITENMYTISNLQKDGKRVNVTGIVTITATSADAGKKIECGAWNEALKDQQPLWTQATLDVQCTYDR